MSVSVREECAFEGGHGQLEEWDDGRLTILCLPRGSTSGYRLTVPTERSEDPWEWLAEEKKLGAHRESTVAQAIQCEAAKLGYKLFLEQSIDDEVGTRWLVSAALRVPRQATVAHPVAAATLREEALELGLEIVKAYVERNEPWPDSISIRGREY